jgi:hypothetical protein
MNGGVKVWVITVHGKESFRMYEFESEREAKELFDTVQGCKILSQVIYFNDPILE